MSLSFRGACRPRPSPLIRLAVAALAAGWLSPRSALADDDAPPSPAVAPATTPATRAVEVNPLSLVVNRLSLTAELMPAPHVALVVTGHVNFGTGAVSWGCDDVATTASGGGCPRPSYGGGGGELGFRVYSGTGLRGVFVGPSGLVAGYKAHESGDSLLAYGAALDVGYQLVARDLMLGFGAGAMWVSTTPFQRTVPLGASPFPRLLLAVGYSW